MASIIHRTDGRVVVEWVSRGKKKQKSFSGKDALQRAEKEFSRRGKACGMTGETAESAGKNAGIKRHITAKNHKTKSDTAAGEVETMQDALLGPLPPPAHIPLTEEEMPFWNSIMLARARSTWNDSDLEQAATLAKTKADIVRVTKEIREEGEIVNLKSSFKVDENGDVIPGSVIYKQVANPKVAQVSTMRRDALAIARAIHVDATSTQGRGRDTGEKTKREQELRDKIGSVSSRAMGGSEYDDDDDLFNRPMQ